MQRPNHMSPRPLVQDGRRRAGFTMVEMAVVLVLVALLASLAWPHSASSSASRLWMRVGAASSVRSRPYSSRVNVNQWPA